MTFYSQQFLRFLAALLVLLFHLGLMPSGYKGVDIFFVISGFVMYYTLCFKPRPAASRFIVNRVTKIYFLYWIALVLFFCVQPFIINGSIFKTLLLVPGHYARLSVSWSLSYELYFYCLIATTAYLVPAKFHKQLFLLLFCISTLIVFLNLTPFSLKGSIINFLLGANFWEFLLGIAAAFFATSRSQHVTSSIAMPVAFVAMLMLLIIPLPYASPSSYIAYGSLSFIIIFCVAVYEKQKDISTGMKKIFGILGDASYAIYLFSIVISTFFVKNGIHSKAVILVVTIVFSIFFNQLIEVRLLKWSRKLFLKSVTAINKIS